MITYKSKEEVLKDIDEHLAPWDQKELADEVVEKYVNLNEYIDNNPNEVDIDDVVHDMVERGDTDTVLDMIDDAYGIAQYVANDRYMTEYMLDEFHGNTDGFIDALNHSTLTLTEILEEVKENEDLYDELKKFVIEECIDENATISDLINNKNAIFK